MNQNSRGKENAKGLEEEQIDDNSPPPGFEFIKDQGVENTCRRQGREAEQQLDDRSKNHKETTQQTNSDDTNSSNTSESLIRLAQDSLHIGELLGVRVTGNVAAAISRITSPLKKGRKQGKKGKIVTKA